jgi:hypothetical protein
MTHIALVLASMTFLIVLENCSRQKKKEKNVVKEE